MLLTSEQAELEKAKARIAELEALVAKVDWRAALGKYPRIPLIVAEPHVYEAYKQAITEPARGGHTELAKLIGPNLMFDSAIVIKGKGPQ